MGGWQLEPFNGIFYPAKQSKGFRKLQFYSRYFDIVEVNATFYSTALTPKNAHRWLLDVAENERFVFSVKLFRGFTHSGDATQEDVKSTYRLLEPMAAEEKLFGVVMQFPYGFTNTEENRKHLEKLGRAFKSFRMFAEVRHNSWNTPDAMQFFKENDLVLLNVDLPQIKRHMPLTNYADNGVAYFRLMGRNTRAWDTRFREGVSASESGRYLYCYTEEELMQIAELIRETSFKLDDAATILHNDPQGNSLFNGIQLRSILSPEEQRTVPATLLRAFPGLQSVTRPDEPSSLFDRK
jgi:uncharacterized protein YecE (DUF72 family)